MTIDSQGEKYRVYIDATIPSYLVSKPSSIPRTAEWQKITREFWYDERFEFIRLNGFAVMQDIRHPAFNPQKQSWRNSHE